MAEATVTHELLLKEQDGEDPLYTPHAGTTYQVTPHGSKVSLRHPTYAEQAAQLERMHALPGEGEEGPGEPSDRTAEAFRQHCDEMISEAKCLTGEGWPSSNDDLLMPVVERIVRDFTFICKPISRPETGLSRLLKQLSQQISAQPLGLQNGLAEKAEGRT